MSSGAQQKSQWTHGHVLVAWMVFALLFVEGLQWVRGPSSRTTDDGSPTRRMMGLCPYSSVVGPSMPKNIKDALKIIKRRATAAGADRAATYDAAGRYFKEVADQLAALRMSLGVPQREVARRAGIDQGDVSKILSGRIPNPGIKTVVRLANALGAEIRLVSRATSSGRVVSAKRPTAKRT